jgi:hypothetical protein
MNPSVADATIDDPTVKKETKFCKRWGFGTLLKCNVMDYRSTDPKGLLSGVLPQTTKNLEVITEQCDTVEKIVAVWGKLPKTLWQYENNVIDILQPFKNKLYCLGINLDNSPKHPLYLKDSTDLIPFQPIRR